MALDLRPREYWIDDVPWDHTINGKGNYYVCPELSDLDRITEIVIHYPGADWNSMDFTKDGVIDVNDTVANVRAGHRMYLLGTRGYSYGYGWIIGRDGIVLTSRGLDYTNAANLGDSYHDSKGWNGWSCSIQLLVDVDQVANNHQINAANELIAWIKQRARNVNSVVWHGFRQFTPCCGAKNIELIKKGLIHLPTNKPLPVPPDPEFPTIPINPSGDEMSQVTQLVRVKSAVFAVVDNGVSKFWITDGPSVDHVALNAKKAGVSGIYDDTLKRAIVHDVLEKETMYGLGPVTNFQYPSPNHGGQTLQQLGWDQFGWK